MKKHNLPKRLADGCRLDLLVEDDLGRIVRPTVNIQMDPRTRAITGWTLTYPAGHATV